MSSNGCPEGASQTRYATAFGVALHWKVTSGPTLPDGATSDGAAFEPQFAALCTVIFEWPLTAFPHAAAVALAVTPSTHHSTSPAGRCTAAEVETVVAMMAGL